MSNANPSDIWRSLPWSTRDAAPAVAAMMVWARLIPDSQRAGQLEAGAFGFFDDQQELTGPASSAILRSLRRKRSDHGDSWAFDHLEKMVDEALPGTLESLRQKLRKFLAIDEANKPNLEQIRQCARSLIDEITDEDQNLSELIINALQAGPDDTVYCGFDLSAPVALELAKQRSVYLQLPNTELAQLMALLAIAGNYVLQVSCSQPVQSEQDAEQPAPRLDERTGGDNILRLFDHAVALPPFGVKYSSGQANSKYGGMSSADSLHISLVLARGAKRRAILVPDGFLFRTAKNDQTYKRKLISNYGLNVVISLPRGIIGRDSGVLSSLLIFDTANTSPDQAIRFVDCRSQWPSKSRLQSPQAAQHQVRAWLARVNSSADDKHIALVGIDELAANDFNLLVDRYVIAPEIRRQRQLLDRQQTIPLDDLAEIYRPQVFKPTPEHLRPPAGQIITMREVATGDIHDGIVEYPEKQIDVWAGDIDQIERVILRPGDILISIKGKVGVAGVVPESAPDDIFGAWTAGQSFVIARLRKSTVIDNPAVLARYLASPFGQTQLQALAGGTTVPSIQMADLRRLPIPVPPINAQREIVQKIEQTKKLREQIKTIESEISERERHLSDLFFGDHEAPTKKTQGRS